VIYEFASLFLKEAYMDRHGEVYFSWDNDIFVLEVEGPFNEKAIEYYTPILQEAIINRSADQWKRLEIWDNEALGCPKTLALAKAVFDWYDVNGCGLTAIVISNVVQSHIIKDILKSDAEIFLDKSDAMTWLNTHNNNIN